MNVSRMFGEDVEQERAYRTLCRRLHDLSTHSSFEILWQELEDLKDFYPLTQGYSVGDVIGSLRRAWFREGIEELQKRLQTRIAEGARLEDAELKGEPANYEQEGHSDDPGPRRRA
jgi:hypothetical protein